MKKRKNLERAIVLGLMLSTSICGTAFAEDIETGSLWDSIKLPDNFKEGDNLIIKAGESQGIGFNGTLDIGSGNLTVETTGGQANGINVGYTNGAQVNIWANDISLTTGANGIYTELGNGGIVNIGSEDRYINSLSITSKGQGIDNKHGIVKIYGNNDITIHSTNEQGTYTELQAAINNSSGYEGDGVEIVGKNVNIISDAGNGIITGLDRYGKPTEFATTNINSDKTTINASNDGIQNADGITSIKSDIIQIISGYGTGDKEFTGTDADEIANLNNKSGINATKGTVELISTSGNTVSAGTITDGFGNEHSIKASGNSTVELNTENGNNTLAGVVYAKGDNNFTTTTGATTLDENNAKNITTINLIHDQTGSNIIKSNAHGSVDEAGNREKVVAALYAQGSAEINVIAGNGGKNYIETKTTLSDGETEQTIWAQQGGKINIDGQTTIIASNVNNNTDIAGTTTEQDGNSLGIAITAGTGKVDGLSEITDITDENRSTVNITTASGSSIIGDIVSGYGGLINIGMDVNNKTRAAGTVENIKITGNALAANGGKLNINLGNGGTWTGRADDYGDAGSEGADGEAHQKYYNPAFSNDILEGGAVNLKMGDNSTWKVQGQSWITSIDTSGAENATIDLVEANTDKNESAHALTIYNLKGNANINMSLDGDRTVSDMLYIKNAEGEYNIALADAVTTADMYTNGHDGLRFATVGDGSNVKFNAGSYDAGVFNVEYEVGTDEYDGNTENDVYNGKSLNTEKPGTDNVDDFFDYDEADPNEGEITKLAEVAGETALDEVQGTTNYKLIARKGESISDAGNTVLNMSKANYSQAVYMDTLNKRLGEARYLEGDEGLWIRMRHDKIDKDNSYEITTNMYELGYDKKYECEDKQGYHRRGVAIDYMDGDTSYDDIAGGGETNRKGIWLYDTWIGNKGHYTDYVAKWGHLENSFDLYTKTRGEKVSGEYDNDVYSLSAEWGYKDQLNNDWYIEPQVQLQYARVTGADYETSQGTQVSVDGIDSLIARAGFRLGKDFGEEKKSTVYVKADILHEFLGDQDISVLDKTTDGKITSIGYDNDGTWYSVGLGFSTMLSDNSYAFLDVEKLFGNDNDNSYQINGGFNWLL